MYRKYVDVISLMDKNGLIRPLYLIWENKRKYPIIKIKEITPCLCLKQANKGYRYTCLFEANRIRHLYLEDNKWFVQVDDRN